MKKFAIFAVVTAATALYIWMKNKHQEFDYELAHEQQDDTPQHFTATYSESGWDLSPNNILENEKS